jgi:hypothetical protein
MAILAALFGLIGRFTGKLLTMSLGWASVLLFGRVPRDREVFLAAITFGSVIWVFLIIGVALPDVGAFLLAFAPIPDWVDEGLVRLAMLVAVITLPLALGAATLKLLRPDDRPVGVRAVLIQLARGYPLAAGLSLMLVFLGIIGLGRKVTSLARRWTDTHIPIVVKPGDYERLVVDLDTAISDAGVDVSARDAPAVMVIPGQLLGRIAGQSVRGLVPDRLVRLVGKDVEVLIYPSDVAVAGRPMTAARVQAALASRLTTAHAWLTTSAEAQAIEESLARLAASRPGADGRAGALARIDQHLATDELPYDEWEILYRQRLQVERDLLLGRRPGEVMPTRAGSAAAGARGSPGAGFAGYLRRDPLGGAIGAAGLGLLALNAFLLVAERRSGH